MQYCTLELIALADFNEHCLSNYVSTRTAHSFMRLLIINGDAVNRIAQTAAAAAYIDT